MIVLNKFSFKIMTYFYKYNTEKKKHQLQCNSWRLSLFRSSFFLNFLSSFIFYHGFFMWWIILFCFLTKHWIFSHWNTQCYFYKYKDLCICGWTSSLYYLLIVTAGWIMKIFFVQNLSNHMTSYIYLFISDY